MIKQFLNNLCIRALQHIPYVRRLQDNLNLSMQGELSIESLVMKDGKLDITLRSRLVSILAQGFFDMLQELDAENYVECSFWHEPSKQAFALTAKRYKGKSPHQLRMIAEAERDEAIAARDKAIAEKEQLESVMLGVENEDTEVLRGRK